MLSVPPQPLYHIKIHQRSLFKPEVSVFNKYIHVMFYFRVLGLFIVYKDLNLSQMITDSEILYPFANNYK